MLRALDSERLHLRPLVETDYALFHSLQSDPELMKNITEGVPRTAEQTRASFRIALDHAKEHPGLGFWVIEQKTNFEAMGICLLRLPALYLNMHGFEIGYMLARPYWGKGLATEVSRAMIDYAFHELKLYRLVAIISPENEASRNVLNKLGFALTAPIHYRDAFSGEEKPSEAYFLDNTDS